LTLAIVLSVCLAARAQSKRKKGADDDKKVLIPHHSFAAPLQYEDRLDDWYVSGASLVERQRMLLHPAIPERQGFVFSMSPLITANWEAVFQFRQTGESSRAPGDQSFAFWYAENNVSADFDEATIIKSPSWAEGMKTVGHTFSGFPAKFKGWGAILSATQPGGGGVPKPVVSFVSSSGSHELKYGPGLDAPTRAAKAVDFRNTLNPAQMKIRVTPTSIEGHVKQSPSLSWNECFKVDRTNNPVQEGGYIGFSAWSGTADIADLVSIVQLDVWNHDDTKIGEDMKDVSAEIQNSYKSMLLDENRHFIDQRSQAEHLQRLQKMLGSHMETSEPADLKMFQDLEGLQTRMLRLDEDCKTLVKEVHILVKNEGSRDNAKSMMEDIVGLRRLFIKDSATHRVKIAAVQQNVENVKKVSSDSSSVLADPDDIIKAAEAMRARTKRIYQMLMFLMVGVAVFGFVMYNQMQTYERKNAGLPMTGRRRDD